jgi:hypothetical protein
MRCLACNALLTDREASRKYTNHATIANPEERYIDLCDHCLVDTDLNYIENSTVDNTHDDSVESSEPNSEVYVFGDSPD